MKSTNLKRASKITVIILCTVLFSAFATTKIQAQTVEPVTVKSSMGFQATISALRKAISGGGMMVLSELNQGKILSMAGLSINAESLFIGNPNVGKKAFSADPAAGVVIPVRINIYEENGSTYVNYFKPSDLFSSFKSNEVKMIGKMMDKKLKMMTGMLAK